MLYFPDLFIYLDAPVEVIQQRRIQRNRPIDIIKNDDIATIQGYIEKWLVEFSEQVQLIKVASDEELLTDGKLEWLGQEIAKRL